MGFLDKAKAAAVEATAKAKEGVEDVQTKRELSQAYNDLGKTAFDLIKSGELSDPRLDDSVAKIRALTGKLDDDGAGTQADAGDAQAYDSSQPPAMPT